MSNYDPGLLAQKQSLDMHTRLKRIFIIAIPIIASVMILSGLLAPETIVKTFLITIGSSVIAAWLVLVLERLIIGDPFSKFYDKMLLFGDASEAGLKRIVLDRNAFFHGPEIIRYINHSKNIRICGTALGFVTQNKELLKVLQQVAASNGIIELLLAHPASDIVAHRDKEERWHGNLRSTIRTSLTELFELKKAFPLNIKLHVFGGEIHNTIISTDKDIIVNPYVFGKKGWVSPAFIFSKTNSSIISDFEGQMDEMLDYEKKQGTGILTEVENDEQLKEILSVTYLRNSIL